MMMVIIWDSFLITMECLFFQKRNSQALLNKEITHICKLAKAHITNYNFHSRFDHLNAFTNKNVFNYKHNLMSVCLLIYPKPIMSWV